MRRLILNVYGWQNIRKTRGGASLNGASLNLNLHSPLPAFLQLNRNLLIFIYFCFLEFFVILFLL